MSSQHSVLSPSSASRWINCPGSVALCKDIPSPNSKYADEGTKAHEYAAWLLNGAKAPILTVDDETVSFVSVYTNAIRQAAEGKMMFVEQRIAIDLWTMEKGGGGTADAIILDEQNATIEIHDLKYGQGVMVYAENNEQLMLYALGALDVAELLWGFPVKEVKLVIHQPRRDHLSEWTVSRSQLVEFGAKVQAAGIAALTGTGKLNPSEKACRWCPAKTICPALTKKVHEAMLVDFSVTSKFPNSDTLDLVELWVKSVKVAIAEHLNGGGSDPNWKLVAGRQGNRAWTDAAAVETLCKAARLKKGQVYNTELKSPAQLETSISQMAWKRFTSLIGRSDAKPTVAPASDPRPAIPAPSTEEFEIFT